MIKVNCPTCGVRLSASDELIGKPVNCQKCNTKFILSRRWTSEPLFVAGAGEADPDPARDLLATESSSAERRPTSTGAGDVLQPAPSSDSPVSGKVLLGHDSSLGSSAEAELGPVFDFSMSDTQLESVPDTASVRAPASAKSLLPANLPPGQEFGQDLRQSNSEARHEVPRETQREVRVAPSIPETINRANLIEFPPTTQLHQFRETAIIWQFFDFRFRSYLTPGIIRLSWFLILMVVGFWLLLLSYFFLSSIIQREPFVLPSLQAHSIDQSSEAAAQSDSQVLIVPSFFFNAAIYFTYVIVSLTLLLWTRVLFETVIMVFCIGAHLQSKRK